MPASVGIPGNYQSEAGCAGDWDPACPATQLIYDANGDIWRNTFSIAPAGAYEYKVALNGTWDVNYGLHAQQNGPNIPLATSAAPQSVTFYYDDKTHWVTENVSSIIATVPGNFQSEMGCSGDWDPAASAPGCRTSTTRLFTASAPAPFPPAPMKRKVALNGNWDVNYGAGRRAERTQHRVHGAGGRHGRGVSMELHDQGIAGDRGRHPGRPDQGAGVLALGRHHRLECSHRYGGQRCSPIRKARSRSTAPASSPGRNSRSWTLTHDPAGLSPALRALSAPRESRGVQVAGRRGRGRRPEPERPAGRRRGSLRSGRRCHALQIPGVLDDLYSAKAGPVTLGPSFKNGQATLRVWAPTARDMKLRVFADSNPRTMFTTYPMTLDPASGIWSYTAPASSLSRQVLPVRDAGLRAHAPTGSRPMSSPIRTRSRWRATARAARSCRWTIRNSSLVAGQVLAQATSRRARGHRAVRAARARLQRHRRKRSGGACAARTRRSRRSARMA